MLQYNPVLAAKYHAMTRAADDAAAHAGPQQGRAAQAAARARRQGPRGVCRLIAALTGSTAWSSTTPAGILPPPPAPPAGTTPRAPRRRPPDQRFPGTTRDRCPRPSSPMRGRASPHCRWGPNPETNPGQLSPSRPELLTSSVERCRSRPARIMPGTPSPLALRRARRPGWPGTPDRAAPRPSCRRGTPPCPHSRPPGPRSRATPSNPTPP